MDTKKDIVTFQNEVCKKTCILKGKCIEEGKNDHWFLMCPHYHPWKFGYTSFIWDKMKEELKQESSES